LYGCLTILFVAVAGLGGFLAVRAITRANLAARFEKDLPAYVALMPALPPQGAGQPRWPEPAGIRGKVKGKMVVVNASERGIDDLHFALPEDLAASKPEEVATVVLVTWEKRKVSGEGPISAMSSAKYQMVGQVRVFDWQSKSAIASRMFFGSLPTGGGYGSDQPPVTGPKPDSAQVVSFLTGLPRQ
jgi:hypothetical protein